MTVLGLRGTGDWETDQRPKNWREMILYLYPNGDAPLTALLSRIGSQKTDDPQFYWWTKTLPAQSGAITQIYTDAGLANAYTTGGVAGDVLYVVVAAATVAHFREGHEVLLRYTEDYTVDVVGKCLGVIVNGATSVIVVELWEADDNSTDYDLSDADRILVIGNINAEGAEMPEALSYNPEKIYNYTQIFRTPLSITRTARKTRLRTGDQYKESKREALELHSIEMEKAFLWGIARETTGENGKPERTTRGLINVIRTYAAANCDDFSTNTDYATDAWLSQDAYTWLMSILEQIFRYGSRQKLAFCGSGALLGLNMLGQYMGSVNITPATKFYGMQMNRWVTPFGDIMLVTHPLFSYETTNRHSMVIFEPAKLKYRYIDDTAFYADKNETSRSDRSRVDGTDEEFLTECGLEFHHPLCFGYLNGVGVDSCYSTTVPPA